MVNVVQGAKPLGYDVIFEGALAAGVSARLASMAAGGMTVRQLFMSAESACRVDFFRQWHPGRGKHVVAAVGGEDLWLFLSDGRIVVSADGGRSFAIDFDCGASIVCACGGLANGEVIVVCENRTVHRLNAVGEWSTAQTLSFDGKACVGTVAGVAVITGDGHLARSTDNGATWTESNLTDTWGASLCAFADEVAGAIYLGRNIQLFRSVDAGVTWTLIDARSYDCGAAYAGVVVAGGRRSADGGDSWVDVLHPSLPGDAVSVCGRITADTWIAATRCGWIYRSVDNGVTWTQVDRQELLDCVPVFTSLTSGSGDHLFLAGNGSVAHSADGGLTFNRGEQVDPWMVYLGASSLVEVPLLYTLPLQKEWFARATADVSLVVLG